ncbi:O-antigen ligase family protein [Halomonas salipaludis]|uniref:Ligase n=1 Tax=Halomonas salipaludis TaxID=2032625 RepID=A0A2A2F421_9GAMM|nr:O-antigen ligase family protein [Halomonas salipaludis]PAU79454.1 ligase [Halomonas salipaludis]
MNNLYSRHWALALNQWSLLLVLVLLIATPVRSHAVVAVLMLYAIGYLVAYRRSLTVTRFDWVVIGLLGAFLLSRLPIYYLDPESRYLAPGAHMVALVPIYLMLRHLVYPVDVRQLRQFMELGVIIGSIGAFAVALVQTQWLGHYRADGFLFSINLGYLSCAMGFLAVCLIRDGRYRRWLLAAAVAAGITCLLTLARGAILAMPLLLVLSLALNIDRLGKRVVAGAIAAMLALPLIGYAMLPAVQERVDYTVNEVTNLADGNIEAAVSSGGRLQLWTAASHAFLERPLIGLGYDERESLNAELVEQGVITEWVLGVSRGHAHSQYMEVAATGGVLGLLALFGYLVMPAIFHWRLHRREPDNPWPQVALVFTAGFALYNLTEAAIHHEMMATFYAYMQVMLLVMARQHMASKPVH